MSWSAHIRPDERDAGTLWAGGVSALALGAAYLVIFPLYAHVGPPPATAEAWMAYLTGRTTVWWAILWLSVLTDILFVPFALSLYAALKHVHRAAMRIAVGLMLLFVVLDLAVTWSHYAALLTIQPRFAAAATDAQRSEYLAAATYASAVLASPLEIVYAIVVLSVGILIVGVAMWRGSFGAAAAWLGVATGVLGIGAVSASAPVIILNAVAATLWILVSGIALCRLAVRAAQPQGEASLPGETRAAPNAPTS
jgi:hypothetical protein